MEPHRESPFPAANQRVSDLKYTSVSENALWCISDGDSEDAARRLRRSPGKPAPQPGPREGKVGRGTPSRLPSGVADALFAKVQQRVLGVLFGNPGRSFYANEVIALAGSGTGAVQRELGKLEAAGLVVVTRVGNQKHYQANPDSPVFAELRALALKTFALTDVLRGVLAPLAKDIQAAFVYGSIARGSDTSESDIDLMVLSDRLTYADLFASLERPRQVSDERWRRPSTRRPS